MKTIALDLGKTSAYWIDDIDYGEEFTITTLTGLYSTIYNLIKKYKPDVILYPHPVRYYNVYRKHWQYIGVLNLLCERNEIQSIEVKDSQAKKSVLGNGRAKKPEIMARYEEKSEHIADCKMFLEWYEKAVDNG